MQRQDPGLLFLTLLIHLPLLLTCASVCCLLYVANSCNAYDTRAPINSTHLFSESKLQLVVRESQTVSTVG